jgi:amino acid adenylation domain-containing protein
VSLTTAAVEDVYRLSPLQEGMLFHSLDRPEDDAYVVQLSCRLRGRLDADALRRAWSQVIARHPVLRTSFHWEETEHAVQVVHAEIPVPWIEEDWRGRAPSDREERFQSWLRADHARGFDLARAPLLRIALLREEDDRHLFVWTHHHLILDGWSLPIVLTEVFEAYRAEISGRSTSVSRGPAFRGYIAWLRGRERSGAEAFWRSELADFELATPLPLSRGPREERPASSAPHAVHTKSLTAPQSAWLEDRARRIGITPATLIRGAWGLLLARLTGERDVVFGEVVSGRPPDLPGAGEMVGLFINTVPVRMTPGGMLPVARWLTALQQRAGERRPYEHHGLVEIQGWSGIPRGAALFETLTIFENYPLGALHGEGAPDLEIDDVTMHERTTYPLTLTVVPGASWLLRLEYDTTRYAGADVARLGRHLERLLEEMASRPEEPVGAMRLLGEEERRLVVEEWNATEAAYPRERCVHERVSDQVRLRPEAEAVRDAAGAWSYADLDRRSGAVARELVDRGVGAEDRIGVLVARSSWTVAALLGVLRSGAAYVPLDESHPEDRLRWMIRDCGIRMAVVSEAWAERARGWGVEVLEVEKAERRGVEAPRVEVDPDQLAYVIYTSGSTGLPKGVMVPHRALSNFLHAMGCQPGFRPADRLLAVTSVTFDIAALELFLPLISGGQVVVADRVSSSDGHALRELLARERPTCMQATPSTWHLLLEAGWRREDAPGLRSLCGGEALSEPMAASLLERCEAVWNLYGPTETTVWSTLARMSLGEPVTIGVPIANTRAYVLDVDGNLAPPGAAGELVLGGDGVTRGYQGQPARTAERFTPGPFGPPGGRVYRTGDRARRLQDGRVEFLGRLDGQLKIRGHRIEPGEVEAALLEHPAVAAAAVVASGEDPGLSMMAGFVVAHEVTAAPTPEGLREFLRARLPEVLVPSRLEFVDSLPRTAGGKLDRRTLSARAAEAPKADSFVLPRSELERRLASLWQDVLGIDRVGATDDFFQLGGHSILATRLVARVRDAFGVRLSLRRLLDHPTVAGLAAVLVEHGAGEPSRETPAPPLPAIEPDPANRYEPFPLTDVQEAYWVGRSDAFELGRIATHAYAEVEIESLDIDRLQRAWRRLIDRHDMLRAVVLPDGRQRVLQDVPPYTIEVLDLVARSEREAEALLAEWREELSHQVLPADRWPLFDVRAARLPGGRTRLFTSFDLLIGDAWSFQVLGRELARLYEEPDTSLPPLEISFRDYVLTGAAVRRGDLYRSSLEYWRQRLEALPPAPELPLAVNPASIEAPRFSRREARLEPEAWKRFRSFAGARGLTPSGAVAAAFSEVLAYWSAAPRFTLNLTLFHRPPLHPQLNELVGDFTSVDLLEVDLSVPGSFEDRARRIQQRLWDDLDHSWVSGIQVLRELSRARGGAVLMPVVFTSVLDLEAPSGDPPAADLDAGGGGRAGYPSSLASGRVVFSVTQTPQVWLDHQASEEQGAMAYSWDAVDTVFPLGVLDSMFEAYRGLLERLASNEAAWGEEILDLRTAAQRERHDAANATETPLEPCTLVDLFTAQEPLRVDAKAVIAPGRSVSYAELGAISRDVASRVLRAGARPDTLVAVVMEKGWEQVAAVLGVAASGAAYLPVDPSLPPERIRHLLARGECLVALTQPWHDSRIDWPGGLTRISVGGDSTRHAPSRSRPAGMPWNGVPAGIAPEHLAYVIFTSGSTGEPKGVMIEHRAAVNTILDVNRRFSIGPEDRVLALSSLSFDLSVWDIFGTLAAGAAVIVPEPGPPDPARWARALREQGVTVWDSVPALMELTVEYLEGRRERLPETLRLVLLSGDWIPLTLPDRIRALGSEVEVVSLGGATEASIWSILHRIGTVDPAWASIPYGLPMANQSFHILDEALRPRPDAVPGELYIGGAGLARGYWRDEARTRERFAAHPRSGERRYRTGDLGRWRSDGEIEFLGRRDFQVKIQGYRIELGEIEAALTSHPEVGAAVVIARGGKIEAKRLIAYVVPAVRPAPSPHALREHLARKLPAYMMPSQFVELEALPLGSNGKVDRSALPEPAAEVPGPETSIASPREPRGTVTPFAAVPAGLEPIGRIVAEILGAEHVDPSANFLELGASSVDIIRVANRLESDLGFRPGIEAFYRDPSIAGLARLLELESATSASRESSSRPLAARAPAAPTPLIVDPGEREAFRKGRPGWRRLEGARLPLSREDATPSARHRSRRRFLASPVTGKDLGRLLASVGATFAEERPRYRFGSAGGLYPVQVYVHAAPGRVDGVEAGTYYYDPMEHTLVSLSPGAEIPHSVHEPFVNRPTAESAAFTIFLVGELAAIEPLYGEHALRFATLEAGLMTQILEEEAAAVKLGLCQIGTLEFDLVRPLFDLGPSHVFLNCIVGGIPETGEPVHNAERRAPEPARAAPAREEFEL